MNVDTGNYNTTLSGEDIKLLKKLKKYLANKVELPKLGCYSSIGDEGLWLKIVLQFCVMGGTRMIDNLKNKSDWQNFKTEISLNKLLSIEKNHRQANVSEILKKYEATRFFEKQAERIDKLLNNPSIIKNQRIVLLANLSHREDYTYVRRALMERNPDFKLKSASDFMINTGLSHNVIALDTRVVGILERHFKLNVNVSKVQGNCQIYLSIEKALREACGKLNLSLAHLDRMLFRFSGKNAISFIMDDL